MSRNRSFQGFKRLSQGQPRDPGRRPRCGSWFSRRNSRRLRTKSRRRTPPAWDCLVPHSPVVSQAHCTLAISPCGKAGRHFRSARAVSAWVAPLSAAQGVSPGSAENIVPPYLPFPGLTPWATDCHPSGARTRTDPDHQLRNSYDTGTPPIPRGSQSLRELHGIGPEQLPEVEGRQFQARFLRAADLIAGPERNGWQFRERRFQSSLGWVSRRCRGCCLRGTLFTLAKALLARNVSLGTADTRSCEARSGSFNMTLPMSGRRSLQANPRERSA